MEESRVFALTTSSLTVEIMEVDRVFYNINQLCYCSLFYHHLCNIIQLSYTAALFYMCISNTILVSLTLTECQDLVQVFSF